MKLKPGAFLLIDDAEDPALPELLQLIEDLKGIKGIVFETLIEGIAVFRRHDGDSFANCKLDGQCDLFDANVNAISPLDRRSNEQSRQRKVECGSRLLETCRFVICTKCPTRRSAHLFPLFGNRSN